MPRSAIVVALLSATVGCGGKSDDGPIDAGPCWPLAATPGGQVELGTGSIAFEPLPPTMAVMANGSQAVPYLDMYARIRGMPPGNPQDFFDPTNPRTKMTVTVPGLGVTLGVPCPSSIGYVPSPESGAFDLLHSLRVGIGSTPIEDFDGQQATLLVEVVGSNGLYAKDEKTVMLTVLIETVDAGVDAPSD